MLTGLVKYCVGTAFWNVLLEERKREWKKWRDDEEKDATEWPPVKEKILEFEIEH
jgi:hypothetical protein